MCNPKTKLTSKDDLRAWDEINRCIYNGSFSEYHYQPMVILLCRFFISAVSSIEIDQHSRVNDPF